MQNYLWFNKTSYRKWSSWHSIPFYMEAQIAIASNGIENLFKYYDPTMAFSVLRDPSPCLISRESPSFCDFDYDSDKTPDGNIYKYL